MKKLSAKMIADSINTNDVRLSSLALTFPRIVLPELNTHRNQSNSTRSSRAVPILVLLWEVIQNPATPVEFGAAKSGMQSNGPLKGIRGFLARRLYLLARWPAVLVAYLLHLVGVHKQVANRILEPWAWTHTLITATDFENFFSLRCHPDADPTMRALAEVIRDAVNNSEPRPLKDGEWHTPYVLNDGTMRHNLVSAARCARVSYAPPSGLTSVERDLGLARQLTSSDPIHASPFEHVARADAAGDCPEGCRNFVEGFVQLRHLVETDRVAFV